MNRYQECFSRLESDHQGAFVPFVVLGDPGVDESLQLIQTLAESGADALELGFPFSDPLADGPTIQGAMTRALDAGVTPAECFEIIRRFRGQNETLPLGLLVYANLVHAFGIRRFYDECRDAGVDSVLVADVPVIESEPFCEAARAAGVAPILLCPPNISEPAIRQVARFGRGYTYLLSRAGVTGTTVAAEMPVERLLQQLNRLDAAPPLLGFGISRPEHVAQAIRSGARGVIVGSAVVEIIERHLPDLAKARAELADFVKTMKAATSTDQAIDNPAGQDVNE